MGDETGNLSHDSAANNGKESLLNTENKPLESQEVQAGDGAGALGSGEGSGSGWGATSSKEIVNEKKKGRGRPRKYENDVPIIINGSLETFPLPTAYCSTTKRARGRPKGTGKFQALASVGGYLDTAGGSFTPHVMPVYKGEDLVNKIVSFSSKACRSVCVLTASGAVSSVTLSTPSVGTLTYEGRFEILTLTGSSVLAGELGTRRRTGLLSVSLANSHGRVFGGSVEGPLIAAGPGPIQLIVASFKQNIGREIRRKYDGGTSTSANIFGGAEMVNVPIQVTGMADNEKCTSPPVPVTTVKTAAPVNVIVDSLKSDDVIVAGNPTFNSTSLESIDPNNWQKTDNLIAENHDLSFGSQEKSAAAGPNNLLTSPVSHFISDEMITPDNNTAVSDMHLKD